jgi:rod shape-determining protein MreC
MALSSRPRNTRLVVVSLVFISLLTITIDYRGGQSGPFETAGRGALQVVSALQGAVSRVVHPVSAFFSGLIHVGSLRSENARLKGQIRQLQVDAGQRVQLERQREELQKLLDLKDQFSLHGVAARVVAESPGNFEWSVTIDAGSSDGLRVDDPVVSGDGLVGHVIEVAPHAAKVQLIIDPSSAVAARLSSSGETGLLIGERNQPLELDLVDAQAEVQPGEQVVTSGYQVPDGHGLYPAGLPIGVVSHVFAARGALTTTVQVAPAVDFSALEFLLVLTPAP